MKRIAILFGAMAMAVAMTAAIAAAQSPPPLASGELRIVGLDLDVGPATQTVPRNQATGLTTALVDPAHPGVSAPLGPTFVAGLRVVGEISGPGLEDPLTISTVPGQILPIPALLVNGNYVVDNLRLEDAGGAFLLPAQPAVASINVVERVIVTSVSSRPLSLEEIQDRGIVIDASNFTAYEFTFGIGTESKVVSGIWWKKRKGVIIRRGVTHSSCPPLRAGAGG